MMNANTRNAECGGKRRIKRHGLGIAGIGVRIRFFQFSPVFDEIGSAHRFFSFGTNLDSSGL
jgi:hypothetical protein